MFWFENRLVHAMNPFVQLGHWRLAKYWILFVMAYLVWSGIFAFLVRRGRQLGMLDVFVLLLISAPAALYGAKLFEFVFWLQEAPVESVVAATKLLGSGRSFHGGLAGFFISLALYARAVGASVLPVLDAAVVGLGPAIFLGRLGNFVNGQIVGTPTTLPFGVIFPRVDLVPRHPVGIYEAMAEGMILFLVMWSLYFRTQQRPGTCFAAFLFLYGLARFAIDFLKADLRPLWGFTPGQLLSLSMMAGALALAAFLSQRSIKA